MRVFSKLFLSCVVFTCLPAHSNNVPTLAPVVDTGAIQSPSNPTDSHAIYRRWLDATLRSLNCMRQKDGLIADAVSQELLTDGPCPVKLLNSNTSPTNIGFDLLILFQENSPLLSPTLAAVEKLQVDPDTGLFYNWYNSQAPFEVRYPYLSSIDNFHMALALWVLANDHHDPSIRSRAKVLFDRMNFSKFLYQDTQLVRGGLSETWAYKHFGTEARSIYSAGWPMGIFKKQTIEQGKAVESPFEQTPEQRKTMLGSLWFEVAELPIEQRTIDSLATWDGGAFQLFLPELLVGESSRSFKFKNYFDNFSRFVENETRRRGLSAPAAHSASQFCITDCEGVPRYNGKAGSLKLASKFNNDPKTPYLGSMWEAVFTPHAGILTLLASDRLLHMLTQAESLPGLYDSRIGWADGYWVGAPRQNEVVPVQLALDQQMIAMTLSRLLSDDNQSVSQRALNRNSAIKSKLNQFYESVEPNLISK